MTPYKVVLIVPSRVDNTSKIPRWFREVIAHFTPLGLAYLGAALLKHGFEVVVLDQLAEELDNRGLVRRVAAERPDLVGITAITPTMANVEALVPLLRQACPRATVVLGNLHASLFAAELLKAGLADVIVHGEGEVTIVELAEALRDGASLEGVPGTSFRAPDGSVVHNAARPPVEFDSLAFPRWDLVNLDAPAYRNMAMFGIYGRNASIQASRGCPHKCIFCSHDKIVIKPRYRSVESLVDELEYDMREHGIYRFSFYDAYFPWSKGVAHRFCDEVRRRGLHRKLWFMNEMRVDAVDDDMIRDLKDVGLRSTCLGFESGNQQILDAVGKGTTLEQGREAARIFKKHGVRLYGLFMLGFPGETEAQCRETIDYALDVDPDFMHVALVMPYPGSQLFDRVRDRTRWKDYEKFSSWNYWDKSSDGLVYAPEGMTDQQLLRLQQEGMFRFYTQPKVILRTLLRRDQLRLRHMALGGMAVVDNYLRGRLRGGPGQAG
jgi:radical SAM superfamily enzyme YgiQ (UPF0313 family)